MTLHGIDYSNLPEEPTHAFLALEEQFRARSTPAGKPLTEASLAARTQYVLSVLAARDEYDIKHLSGWTQDFQSIASGPLFAKLVIDVDYIRTRFNIVNARQDRRFSVGLDPETKDTIREYLGKIKRLVDTAELDDRKKEALYTRITDLENEINRDRTRFQAYAALVIEVAGVTGQAVEKLEPLRRWVDSIGKLFGFAKSHEDAQPQLPLPRETKRLERPRKQLPKPDASSTAGESTRDAAEGDDLPF
jgi:hypothetical protein